MLKYELILAVHYWNLFQWPSFEYKMRTALQVPPAREYSYKHKQLSFCVRNGNRRFLLIMAVFNYPNKNTFLKLSFLWILGGKEQTWVFSVTLRCLLDGSSESPRFPFPSSFFNNWSKGLRIRRCYFFSCHLTIISKGLKIFKVSSLYAGVPERSNGIASKAIGLVPTQVQVLSPA